MDNNNLEFKVESINLLSVEEASTLPVNIAMFKHWWWLRTPGSRMNVTAVAPGGHIMTGGFDADNQTGAIRPAIKVLNLDRFSIPLYGEVTFKNIKFIRISKDMLLVNDSSFGNGCFDKKSNDYNSSEILRKIQETANLYGIDFEKGKAETHRKFEESIQIVCNVCKKNGNDTCNICPAMKLANKLKAAESLAPSDTEVQLGDIVSFPDECFCLGHLSEFYPDPKHFEQTFGERYWLFYEPKTHTHYVLWDLGNSWYHKDHLAYRYLDIAELKDAVYRDLLNESFLTAIAHHPQLTDLNF